MQQGEAWLTVISPIPGAMSGWYSMSRPASRIDAPAIAAAALTALRLLSVVERIDG